jgi:hypothetical protein
MEARAEPAWAWLFAGLLLGLAVRAGRPVEPPALAPGVRARLAPRDDPGSMAARDFARILGVGEARAAALVEARFAGHPLQETRDWLAVPGIGPKTLQGIELWLAERGRGGVQPSSRPEEAVPP